LPGIFLLALAVRGGYCLLVVGPHQGLIERLGDDWEYDWHAKNLLAGRGMIDFRGRPTAQRTPGYPLMLAGVYAVFGHSYLAARLMQCVLGAASCLLLYLLVRRWFSSRAATLAAGILAFYPMHIWLSSVLLSENLTVPGLLLAMVLIARAEEHGTLLRWALGGLAAGFLGLVHPILAGLGIVLAGAAIGSPVRRDVRPVRCSVVMLIGLTAPLIGWMARNRVCMGGFVLSSLTGKTFLGANNLLTATSPRHYGYWVGELSPPGVREYVGGVDDELARDRLFLQFALNWLWDNPQYWVRLAAFKIGRFYLPVLHDWRSAEGLVYLGSYGVLLPFMLAGLWGICRRNGSDSPSARRMVVGVLAFYTLVVVIFWGAPRFRQTIDPLLVALAAVTLLRVWDRLRGWGFRSSPLWQVRVRGV